MWAASTTYGWTPRLWDIVWIGIMRTYHDWVVVSIFFNFTPKIGEAKQPIWRACFSDGLVKNHQPKEWSWYFIIHAPNSHLLTASLTLGDEREALKQVFLGTKQGWKTGNPNEQWKKPIYCSWLGYIGDENLPSYVGIISYTVRIAFNQPVYWKVTGFFSWLKWL